MVSWYVLILIGTVFLAASDLIRKHLLNHEHTLEQIAIEFPFRAFILIFFIPFLEPLNTTEIFWVVISAIVGAVVRYARSRTIKHLPISVAAPMHNFSPAILLVFGIVFLKEIPSGGQLIGMGLIMLGGYMLSAEKSNLLAPFKKSAKSKYALQVLTLLVLLSIIATLNRFSLNELAIKAPTYIFWTMLGSFAINFTFHHTKYGSQNLKKIVEGRYHLFFFAALLGVIDLLLFYEAISQPAALIAVAVTIRRSATLIETLFGGAIFHESNLMQKGFACAIMVAGIAIAV